MYICVYKCMWEKTEFRNDYSKLESELMTSCLIYTYIFKHTRTHNMYIAIVLSVSLPWRRPLHLRRFPSSLLRDPLPLFLSFLCCFSISLCILFFSSLACSASTTLCSKTTPQASPRSRESRSNLLFTRDIMNFVGGRTWMDFGGYCPF